MTSAWDEEDGAQPSAWDEPESPPERSAWDEEAPDEGGFFSALDKLIDPPGSNFARRMLGSPEKPPLTGAEKTALYETGVPLAVHGIAGAATGGMSIVPQVASQVGAGVLSRYLTGDEPLKVGGLVPFVTEPGMLQDALWPIAFQTGAGLARGFRHPGMEKVYPDIDKAIERIGGKSLGMANPVASSKIKVAPRPDDIRTAVSDVISNVATSARESGLEPLRKIGERFDYYGEYGRQLERLAHRYGDDALYRAVGPFKRAIPAGAAKDATYLQALRQALKEDPGNAALQQGIDEIVARSPEASRAADTLAEMYGKLAEQGRGVAMKVRGVDGEEKLVDWRDVPGYFGPLVEKGRGLFSRFAPKSRSLKGAVNADLFRGRQSLTAFERTKSFDPTIHEADPIILRNAWLQRYKPVLSAHHAFGRRVDPLQKGSGLYEFGSDVNALLEEVASLNPTGKDLRTFYQAIDALNEIYRQPEAARGLEKIAQPVARGVSNMTLGATSATQLGQLSTNLWKYGFDDTAEGLVRWFRDPKFRELHKASGATRPALVQYIEDSTGLYGPRLGNPIAWTIGGAEKFIRGVGSAGAIPHAERRIAQALGSSGGLPAGLSRQLSEMGIDPSGPYVPSADLIRDTVSTNVHRLQFNSLDKGQMTPWLSRHPLGRLILPYLSFGLDQARLARSQLGRPLTEGTRTFLRSGDFSDLNLGLERLYRVIPALAVGQGISEVAKAGIQMREPSLERILTGAPTTLLGTPADVAMSVARGHPSDPITPIYPELLDNPARGITALNPWLGLLSQPFISKR